ncbi:SOS response-associated peptidase [Halovenus marina]|uniref:SOS response-associated peptidase n=1 Tax=Halovenus marina TaxID=3396621 RepID=UPI003F55B6EC
MCGRTSLFIPQDVLQDQFDARVVTDGGYTPRYNINPGQPLEVITNKAPAEIDQFNWGLLPPWANELSDRYINARSETAHEKRLFSEAWQHRPCLVPSSGFYEWKHLKSGSKQPYRIFREDDPAFAMAGLWQETTINEESVRSVTILTTDANDVIQPIHDRMPVILPETTEDEWLHGGPETRTSLCKPYPEDDLETYPISNKVNNPRNDAPEIIEPESTEQAGLEDF